MTQEIYDIAILGAGPIGLEAALRASDDGYKTVVIERGEVAQNVRDWGHVKLFSPFGMNSSERGRACVQPEIGADDFLTGGEFVVSYLAPLAHRLSETVVFKHKQEVFSVDRLGWPKGAGLGGNERPLAPFDVLTWNGEQKPDLTYNRTLARCVIDTTGSGGVEWGQIQLVPTDPEWRERMRVEPRGVAVIGSGATAATNAVTLADYAVPFTWLTRNSDDEPVIEIPDDPLPGRNELSRRANEVSRSELCERITGRTLVQVDCLLDGSTAIETVDAGGNFYTQEFADVFVNTGLSPEVSFLSELHVHLCYATEGPIKLAAKLLSESGGDCLTQSGSDASLLVNPEVNFLILGAKSYGRNSNFLIRAGIEQVNAVFDELLPETLWPLIGRK